MLKFLSKLDEERGYGISLNKGRKKSRVENYQPYIEVKRIDKSIKKHQSWLKYDEKYNHVISESTAEFLESKE